MKDRLEMSFSRPSRGGGEVKGVEYDKNTGTGCITFLHPGGTVLWATFNKIMLSNVLHSVFSSRVVKTAVC